jgi:uncharacterized protein YodC (DUF2158 family)
MIGDVVRLKASSTKMTVARHDHETGQIVTQWFNDANELQEYAFPPAQLVVVRRSTDF